MHKGTITSLDTVIFNNTMESLGLTQDITQPMHNKCKILDLVFTELDIKITITGCRTNTHLSDHYSIIIDTTSRRTSQT